MQPIVAMCAAAGVEGVGFWGDYRMCDTPRWTIENMLQHIAAEHKVLHSGIF